MQNGRRATNLNLPHTHTHTSTQRFTHE